MKCCGEVIVNKALDKEFYYCRGCKKEVVDKHNEKSSIINQFSDTGLGPWATLATQTPVHDWNTSVFYDLIPRSTIQLGFRRKIIPFTTKSMGTVASFAVPPCGAIGNLTLLDWIKFKVDVSRNDNFCGVNRSTISGYPNGFSFMTQTNSIIHDVKDSLVIFRMYAGAQPNLLLMNSKDFHDLFIAYNSSGMTLLNYVPKSRYFTFMCSAGTYEIYDDHTLPNGVNFAITKDSWEFDPNFNLICKDPSQNMIFKVS